MTLNAALLLSDSAGNYASDDAQHCLSLSDTTSNYTSDNDKAAQSVIWSWEVQKFPFSSGFSSIVLHMLGTL